MIIFMLMGPFAITLIDAVQTKDWIGLIHPINILIVMIMGEFK